MKSVAGNEGQKCHYTTRLDTYGCGCRHDCSYCYAKSLLSFRNLWNPSAPRVADIKKIENRLKKLPPGTVLRLGGMSDCFQPIEAEERVTYQTIQLLNHYGIGYLIVTKSVMIAEKQYMDILDRNLAHVQITVTTLDDNLAFTYERASKPTERIKAIYKLQEGGYDVALRLSPLIEEFLDFDKLNRLDVQKTVVEFLRINTWIMRWLQGVDFSRYTFKQGGYQHLPLEEKLYLLKKIELPLTVCEDVTEHYEYWKRYRNPNPDDCCNLTNRPCIF